MRSITHASGSIFLRLLSIFVALNGLPSSLTLLLLAPSVRARTKASIFGRLTNGQVVSGF